MNEFNYWSKNTSAYAESFLGIKLPWYQRIRIDMPSKILNWLELRGKPRYTKDNKMIIYPNEKFIFSRCSGKTNLEFAIFTAYLEAKETNKPVIVDYGMKLVSIDDVLE